MLGIKGTKTSADQTEFTSFSPEMRKITLKHGFEDNWKNASKKGKGARLLLLKTRALIWKRSEAAVSLRRAVGTFA